MSDPVSLDEARQRRASALADLASSTGGGHDGGMPPDLTARVASLEGKVDTLAADIRSMKTDVQKINVDLAEIKGRLTQMPTVSQLIYGNVGLAVAIAGLVFTIARAMK